MAIFQLVWDPVLKYISLLLTKICLCLMHFCACVIMTFKKAMHEIPNTDSATILVIGPLWSEREECPRQFVSGSGRTGPDAPRHDLLQLCEVLSELEIDRLRYLSSTY